MKRRGDRGQGRLAPEALARRFGLPRGAERRLEAALVALSAEADPPTTVRAPGEAADRHLADSLVALELPGVRDARRVCDVGAGPGFPGLALAIALPDASVDLVEPARRKCEVIDRLIEAAALENARSLAVRAEAWGAAEGHEIYDLVTARAVGSLAVVAEYAAPLLSDGGVLVAWRGRRNQSEELAALSAATQLGLAAAEVRRVAPFRGARDRHLHVFEKVGPTPAGFPRRPGMAAKRPLA